MLYGAKSAEVRDTLNHAPELGIKIGFSNFNLDGYVGCIDFDEGEAMLNRELLVTIVR